jgi:hypothetical protein
MRPESEPTVAVGVERAPVEEMVVVPVCPKAAVFAVRRPLNSFVELAFANALFPVTVIPPLKMLSALYVFAVVVLNDVLNTPVALLYARGYTALSEVLEIFPLNVFQSVELKYQFVLPFASEIEIAFPAIESGAFAVVMRFVYAVFQSVVEAVSGIE